MPAIPKYATEHPITQSTIEEIVKVWKENNKKRRPRKRWTRSIDSTLLQVVKTLHKEYKNENEDLEAFAIRLSKMNEEEDYITTNLFK